MARRNPYAQQVADETALRFDPQVAALAQILSQAGSQYRQDIGQSRAAADLIANMAASSQRALQQPDNPILALAQQHPATSGAAGVVARNLGLTAQSALANLAQQGPLAAQAASYRNQGLRSQYLGDVAKVQGQGQSLAGQIGTYQSARLGELVADQTKRRQEVADLRRKTAADLKRAGISARTSRSNAQLQASTSRSNAELSASTSRANATQAHKDRQAALAAKGGPGKIKPATAQQHGAVKDKVGYAQNVVTTLEQSPTFKAKPEAEQRRLAAQALLNGVPGGQGAPSFKAVPQLSASIALDIAFDGHVSGHNVAELHRRGYSLKQLGFPTRYQGASAGLGGGG